MLHITIKHCWHYWCWQYVSDFFLHPQLGDRPQLFASPSLLWHNCHLHLSSITWQVTYTNRKHLWVSRTSRPCHQHYFCQLIHRSTSHLVARCYRRWPCCHGNHLLSTEWTTFSWRQSVVAHPSFAHLRKAGAFLTGTLRVCAFKRRFRSSVSSTTSRCNLIGSSEEISVLIKCCLRANIRLSNYQWILQKTFHYSMCH